MNGWGNGALLESYDLERREAGLRTIMVVLNFAPDRNQVLRLATIIKYPWLWWTAKYRWMFASTGAHGGNHLMSEGIQIGLRYRSNIIYTDVNQQGRDGVENSPFIANPQIVAGGRIPHILFPDGSTMNQKIDLDGYTLLVLSPTAQVTDSLAAIIKGPISVDKSIRNPVVRSLEFFFRRRKIPLKIVHLEHLLTTLTDEEERTIASIYNKQQMVLVRPDLYIAWFLAGFVKTISIFDLERVAQVCCSEVYDFANIQKTIKTSEWLTRRFISNIQGYKSMHNNAVYIENEDKGAVLQLLSRKAKLEKSGDIPVKLTTKATEDSGYKPSNNRSTPDVEQKGEFELSTVYQDKEAYVSPADLRSESQKETRVSKPLMSEGENKV